MEDDQFQMSEEASINYLIEVAGVTREEATFALECTLGNVDSALDQLLYLKEEQQLTYHDNNNTHHNNDNTNNDTFYTDMNDEDDNVYNDYNENNDFNNNTDLVTTINNETNKINNLSSIYFGKKYEFIKKNTLDCFRDLMMYHFDLNQIIKKNLNLDKLVKIYLKFEKDQNVIPIRKNLQNYFYKFIIEKMLIFRNELLQQLIKKNTQHFFNNQKSFCDISIQFKDTYNYCNQELKYWKSLGKEIDTKIVTNDNELIVYMSIDGLKNIPQFYEILPSFPQPTKLKYTIPLTDQFNYFYNEYIPSFLICNVFNELQINYKDKIIIEKPLKGELCQFLPEELNHLIYNIPQSTIISMINISNNLYYSDKTMLDILCAFIAMLIKGRTPEEIREMFNIKNDLTPEEEERIKEENKWCEDC
ncbi:hypothetical protein ABK040_008009 [Willaertia magna]